MLLHVDEEDGNQEQKEAVAEVTEHDTKLEGEGHDGEDGGVDLTIAGNTVGVHNLLEGFGELVGLEVSRRLVAGGDDVQDGRNEGARALAGSAESELHLLSRARGAPTLGNEALATKIVVEPKFWNQYIINTK